VVDGVGKFESRRSWHVGNILWFLSPLREKSEYLESDPADTLILGGTPLGSGTSELAAAFAGEQGGLLHTFSTKDGTMQSEIKLDAPPVWDGMAVAGNQLYFTTIDGRLVCYGGK